MSPNRRVRRLALRDERRLGPGGRLFLAFLIGLSALGLSFLYVWQTTQIRDLTARCNSVREDLVKAEEVNRTLQFEIEQAFSLERIERIARERLGMVEPSVVRYVPVHDSGEGL